MFTHVSACLYILLAELESDHDNNWVLNEGNLDGIDLYVISVYFVVTTVATVGYGDISPYTTEERIFCIILMLVGVSSFTFVSGALSSLISNYDLR